jgi:F0F1-type ATP synthase membrane subunit b/b'
MILFLQATTPAVQAAPTTTTIFLALFSTVFAGVFLKIIEKVLNKKKEEVDEAVQIRKELREQVSNLKNEIDSLRKEVIEWREKYWEQVKLTAQQNAVISELRSELSDLRRALSDKYLIKETEEVAIFHSAAESGLCTYVNKTWETLTGMSMTDALDYGWTKIIHPDDVNNVVDVWRSTVLMNEPLSMKYRYYNETLDKSISVLCIAAPTYSDTGEIRNYIGVVLPLEYVDLTTANG